MSAVINAFHVAVKDKVSIDRVIDSANKKYTAYEL